MVFIVDFGHDFARWLVQTNIVLLLMSNTQIYFRTNLVFLTTQNLK